VHLSWAKLFPVDCIYSKVYKLIPLETFEANTFSQAKASLSLTHTHTCTCTYSLMHVQFTRLSFFDIDYHSHSLLSCLLISHPSQYHRWSPKSFILFYTLVLNEQDFVNRPNVSVSQWRCLFSKATWWLFKMPLKNPQKVLQCIISAYRWFDIFCKRWRQLH